ncbi:DUF6069 family protein [Virgisporangium aurantiacum]|uniref:Uncharacterized protein n=1 Tax=Virgisporangium aurantiacum TaxID=175570 RepID=A0A8J3ZEF3_9ACTN|nr:DUF6069 family protein [Virgisporangium aurantiacum]GIJ61387.1 hypothetical protein Vau01_089030 [Virgisporangium aurantiacum]
MKPLYAIGGAVLSTAALWIIARIFDVDLRVDPQNGRPPGEIALPFAAAMALVAALLGWGTRALLGRFTRHAARIWTVVAGVVLLVSFLPILAVGATGGTKAVLALMHLAVAACLVPVLGRQRETARAQAAPTG